eukprot:1233155-Alexandrium_andersonii.AAC.1
MGAVALGAGGALEVSRTPAPGQMQSLERRDCCCLLRGWGRGTGGAGAAAVGGPARRGVAAGESPCIQAT